MRANYEQLTRFCYQGRKLREQFDDDTGPFVSSAVTTAYFSHLRECIVCRRARARLLREHDRAKPPVRP